MPSLKFQRNKEDFTCENCGIVVKGNGYTNHCPECLWSKHVDIDPGDRLADCGGLMKPISLILEKGKFVLNHQCQKCGYEKRNKTAENDKVEELMRPVI